MPSTVIYDSAIDCICDSDAKHLASSPNNLVFDNEGHHLEDSEKLDSPQNDLTKL